MVFGGVCIASGGSVEIPCIIYIERIEKKQQS